MHGTRGQGNAVAEGVGGFHADEFLPGIFRQIGHGLAFGDPWIPHHGATAAGAPDGQGALQDGIVDDDRLVGQVFAVHLAGEMDITVLQVHVLRVHLVQVFVAIQAADEGLVDIAYHKVGVQRAGDMAGGGAGVFHAQGKLEALADAHFHPQRKTVRPKQAGGFAIRQGKNQSHATGVFGGMIQRPKPAARHTMSGEAGFRRRAKPRPADWDAAADGFAFLIDGFGD